MQKPRLMNRHSPGSDNLVNSRQTSRAAGRKAALPPPARTVAFHGAKGGVGATFLAAESAAALAASGRSVAAVDAHLYRGCLHYHLDVPVGRDSFTAQDLVPVLDDLSERILHNAMATSPCGARLLPSPPVPNGSPRIDPEQFRAVLEAAAGCFSHVIFDTPSSADGALVAAAARADVLALVVTPDLSCLGAARRALRDLQGAGVEPGTLSVVVNRSLGDPDTVTLCDVESFLEVAVSVVLPEETARCRRALDEGRFIFGGRTPLGRGLRAMVQRLFSVDS